MNLAMTGCEWMRCSCCRWGRCSHVGPSKDVAIVAGFGFTMFFCGVETLTSLIQQLSAHLFTFSPKNILKTQRRRLLSAPQSTEQVTAFCRSLHDMNPLECPMSSSSSSSSSSLSPSPVSALPPTTAAATQRQLSHADKLRKVISELVETEKTYVKVSTSLST